MFDINDISRNFITGQYTCSCNVGSSSIAKDIQARYLMSINERFNFTAEIGIDGSIVTIASNSPDVTKWIADQINKGYFMPPLDIYVFYGSSHIGLESRWCVGLDITNATKLIDLLNRQGPHINADNSPQNWSDKNGTSYSVVMLTGVLEQEQSEELEKRVNLCLSAIQNVTARKLTVHTIH